MAIVANTATTYDLIGQREDLIEDITMISPVRTPFVNRSGRTRATNTLHEWQTDELAAAAANAHIEGDETTFTAISATTRLTNRTQILKKSVIRSGTAAVTKKAGRGDELPYQVEKLIKELARDLERQALQSTAAVAGNTTTARQMNGVAGFITTNETDKITAAIAEADIHTSSRDAWTEGGEPDIILCSAFNKKSISDFTTGVTKNLEASDKKFQKNVDVFETDFGVMQIIPSLHILADDVYLLDMSLWKIAQLRGLTVKALAETGDAEKRHILMEVTLESRQEKGNASIINTSTS